jgi:signal transduction histidine kinase/ligand-binding sensor domain-containing protein
MPLLPTKLRLYCFAWTIIFPYLLKAQESQELFQRYNVNEGLSQSSVYCIFQDSRGFMWFGTGDGLNRFDGYQFEVYKTRKKGQDGLSSSFITGKALEDKKGNLWFGTRMGGFSKYLSKEHRFESVKNLKHSDSTHFDCELIDFDSEGNLWFIKGSNTLGCFNDSIKSFQYVEMPKSIRYGNKGGPNRMGIIKNDTIYFIGNLKLVAFVPSHKKFISLLENELKKTGSELTISVHHNVKSNFIWLGTDKGIMQYNLSTHQYKWIDLMLKHSTPVAFSIVKDDYNRLWIGTGMSGLLCYDLSTGELNSFVNNPNNHQSLSFDIVRTLFIDQSKNLWIGTDGGGLNKFDLKPRKFNIYAKNMFIKCFYEDENKLLWFGTHENGFYQLNRKNGEIKQIKRSGASGNVVSVITKDIYGHMIIGSNKGVDYYTNGKYAAVPASPDMEKINTNSLIYSLLNTREKTTLATTRAGLYESRYRNGKMDTLRLHPNIRTLALSSYQTQDGRIWIGTEGHSYLFILKYEKNILRLEKNILLESNVRSFYEDKKNKILWMASGMGLIRYDLTNDTHTIISSENGLADNYLYGVLSDERGKLWVSSNKGLSWYNPVDKVCRNYSVIDGLQSNEFNTGAYYKSSTGEMFFGGINGFNSFYPGLIKDNPFLPRVSLTSLKVNDGNIPFDHTLGSVLRMPYDSSTISFEFTALEYTIPAKNNYRYRLEGWDNEWVESGSKRFARYSNLPPGQYTFWVQACNNDKIWGNKEVLMSIIITPPYWKTWWFITILVLGLSFFLFYTIRSISTRKLKEQLRELEKQQAVQKERERISKDMHDDLGSGLSKIAIQSELLKYKLKQNENPELHAERIVKTSRELVDNLSEIVWALNPRHDNPESLLAYIREFTTDLFEDQNVKCIFDFPEQTLLPCFPSEIRRNIFLILKEALNNTFKYAEATEVVIRVKRQNKIITFEVTDNGKGCNLVESSVLGNGMINMEKRAKSLAAMLDIITSPKQGTTIRLTLFEQ